MSEDIRKFIGTDAKAVVLRQPEQAGRLLAKSLGLEIRDNCFLTPDKLPYTFLGTSINLTSVHVLELATIEKVGKFHYCNALMSVLMGVSWNDIAYAANQSWTCSYDFIVQINTADAPTRVAAMLTALGESNSK